MEDLLSCLPGAEQPGGPALFLGGNERARRSETLTWIPTPASADKQKCDGKPSSLSRPPQDATVPADHDLRSQAHRGTRVAAANCTVYHVNIRMAKSRGRQLERAAKRTAALRLVRSSACPVAQCTGSRLICRHGCKQFPQPHRRRRRRSQRRKEWMDLRLRECSTSRNPLSATKTDVTRPSPASAR